ncbi:Protein of unknown function, DUF481 [Terriglobus roseus DSM 18391]|uniref:DUF481 domain-containing protein n=2 Tax=Terriglobus roseus TaxID=392734 RepID=I3ZGF3_TERRK|nr:Protein of unknown function, DUF481 [Terriglobus roseus DSM 18391]AFL88663.1 Protein of unknown function, DUF481 [Terriglobus roseus DSM 18391]
MCLSATPSYCSSREKTDVIFMKNGDRITCEIRSLARGQLTIKQAYANTVVLLDWGQISRIESTQRFLVITATREEISGQVSEAADGSLLTVTGSVNRKVTHDDVVSIQQTGDGFARHLRGNVDLGFSVAQANSQLNVALNGDITYSAMRRIFSVNARSQFTSQRETRNTRELGLQSEYFHQLKGSTWYGGGIANLLSSSEQEIALRTTLGAALAVHPISTNSRAFTMIGALAYTAEQNSPRTATPSRADSIDAALAVQGARFRFDSASADTTLWILPSLTYPGRVRLTMSQDAYYRFLKDFYVRASFYDNYDTRPVAGAPANNLGISTTVGWSFR